ncbi:MAG: 7TM diverse intracellular signaling domain-containing protein [Bacteroidota bacterium]
MNNHYFLKNYFFFFCLIFLLLSSKLSAQVKFEQSWYYTAVDTVSFKDLDKKPFKHLAGNQHPAFHNSGIYWFKLDIENKYPNKDLIIGVKNPHLDSVFLYQRINNRIIAADTAGNNFKLKDSTYLRYIRFKVDGNSKTIWLKTRLKKEILFPVSINTVVDFYQAESLSLLKLGIYYGIAVIVLILNIVLYFSFRDPKFLYYSVLILMVILLYAYSDGLYVLVSRHSLWLNYASLPVMLGAAIASVIFSIKFLELDNSHTYLYRISTALLILMALCFLVYIIFNWTGACILGNMILPLLLTLYWLVALSRFKRHTAARFFVFASTLSMIFTLNFFILRFIGPGFLNVVPGELKIGNILQMLILSIGILYRVKILHKEHAFYREEIERYLKDRPVIQQEEKGVSPAQDVFAQLQEQSGLSEREIDVLKLLAGGLTNQQIGDKLFLSANTVKFHIRNIYLKMGINTRAQAVSRMHEFG